MGGDDRRGIFLPAGPGRVPAHRHRPAPASQARGQRRTGGLSTMFGKKTAPKPDASLLARVSDSSEVDLGTYPEDALAVTGAYPARRSLDPKPDGPSAFRRLDSQSRKAAMQAALDRLIGVGTLNVPHGTSLKDVVGG